MPSYCFEDHYTKNILIEDGDRIKIKFARMIQGQHYKFKYVDGKIYSAVYSGDGITLFARRDYMAEPLDIEDPLYQKIKIPRGVAARRYTCIKCGKETLGWVHVKKRICDECVRKRENARARRARSRRDFHRAYATEDVDIVVREIILSYITNHPEPYQNTYLHTKFIYEWGVEQKMVPSDLSLAVLKVRITNVIPEFGYELYRAGKWDRVFRKIETPEHDHISGASGCDMVEGDCT